MKPRIDLSRKSRFIIWESGGWDGTTNKRSPSGSALVIGGPDGEKLPICYDVNPRRNVYQCAFFANIGQMIAAAFVTTENAKFNVSLELARIEELTTEMVQGTATPAPKLKMMWIHRELVDGENVHEVYKKYDPEKEFHRPEFQNLLKVAVTKACTPLDEQSFCWAIPRPVKQDVN